MSYITNKEAERIFDTTNFLPEILPLPRMSSEEAEMNVAAEP